MTPIYVHGQTYSQPNSHTTPDVSPQPLTYLCSHEALGEEHDLTDELQVGHDDDDRTEQSFDRLGKLCATGVAGVHGDKDPDSTIEQYLLVLKLKPGNKEMTDPRLRYVTS